MPVHPGFKPFNFREWIENNRDQLKPPVGNKQLFHEKTNMIVMIVGGPNQRVDFHDDPVEEFFYQLEGDMILKIAENGEIYDVPIREGEVSCYPRMSGIPRNGAIPGSVGLVVEGNRGEKDLDGFEWYCFNCGDLVHRVEVKLQDIVKDLPPLYDAFYGDEELRKCKNCGTVHPGKQPPPGWAEV